MQGQFSRKPDGASGRRPRTAPRTRQARADGCRGEAMAAPHILLSRLSMSISTSSSESTSSRLILLRMICSACANCARWRRQGANVTGEPAAPAPHHAVRRAAASCDHHCCGGPPELPRAKHRVRWLARGHPTARPPACRACGLHRAGHGPGSASACPYSSPAPPFATVPFACRRGFAQSSKARGVRMTHGR